MGSSPSAVVSLTSGGGRSLIASLEWVFPEPAGPVMTTAQFRVLINPSESAFSYIRWYKAVAAATIWAKFCYYYSHLLHSTCTCTCR